VPPDVVPYQLDWVVDEGDSAVESTSFPGSSLAPVQSVAPKARP
jgi:hypothetical protein